VLIRLIAVVAGLLVVLLVIRYTLLLLTGDYTECNRAECGVGWDILYGAWRALWILLLALVAYGLVTLVFRAWRRHRRDV
jgi:hypothetical protein